jgi:hypothetical protein
MLCGQSKFDISTARERGQILLIELSPEQLGKQEAGILGSLLLAKIFSTQGKLFTVFCDNAELYSEEVLKQSGTIPVWLVHPFTDFLADTPTVILFQSSLRDITRLEFAQPSTERIRDMATAKPFTCFVRTIQDMPWPQPFKIRTLPPLPWVLSKVHERVLRQSRERFGTPQAVIDVQIQAALTPPKPRLEDLRKTSGKGLQGVKGPKRKPRISA